MADDSMSEDQWLYGDSTNDEKPTENNNPETAPELKEEPAEPEPAEEPAEEEDDKSKIETEPVVAEAGEIAKEKEEPETEEADREQAAVAPPSSAPDDANKDAPEDEEEEEEEDEEEDDSDDNVHVTIGDIKAAPQYTNLNIKRGVPLAPGADKLKQQPGKFSIEEFESIGTINGVPAHEFSIDALEEKPWRKPGADITDYFNYGFNEETWRAYCERQKTMRMHESGVGLGGLGVSNRSTTALPVVNDNSKYSGMNSTVVVGARKAGPPPGPRRSGVIDVIGGSGVASRRATDSPPKENAIQVMTADKRDYGRKNFDLSVPPPGFDATQTPIPPVVPSYPPHPTYNQEFYNPEVDPYYPAYEPTQDLQWNNQNNSLPKESSLPDGVTLKQEPVEKAVRDRERERERHKERHRHRSRSRSGDRSERRSRKHKSRSRSPGHRSHKKKKSKKSERTKDNSD